MQNFNINLPAPSHFTAVGIPFTGGLYKTIVVDLIRNGLIYKVPSPLNGYYFAMKLENGVEMWMAINKKYYVEAFTPYYRSDNEIALILDEKNQNSEWRYEGGFVSSVVNKEITTEFINKKKHSGDILTRLVFDVPYYALIKDLDKRNIYKFSITTFADNIQFFKSEKQLLKAQKPNISKEKKKRIKSQGIKPQLSSKAFIPSGFFSGDPSNPFVDKPRPQAVFNGIIKDIRKSTNPKTFLPFFILKVETLDLIFDVVVDIRKVPDNIKPNYYIGCGAWMIGHILTKNENQFLISNSQDCNQIRSEVLKNLREFDPNKDPNPYRD